MKKGLIIALSALVLGGVLLVGAGWFCLWVHGQNEIIRVLNQRSALGEKIGEQRGVFRKLGAFKGYASAIQRIDASGCPKDFRIAWTEYCFAVQNDSEHMLSSSKASPLAMQKLMTTAEKDGVVFKPR